MKVTQVGRWAVLLVALHLALGVLYSVAVPPWEAHDEWAHYKFVEYVARRRSLPPPDRRLTREYLYDEATQPPLYYLIAALPVMLVDTRDKVKPDVNPYFDISTGAGGINAAVHHPEQERFPWRGTLLALHLARWASLLISLAGLIAAYRLGQLLTPEHPTVALLALMITAFSPQYLFIGSVVTNDVLIAALGGVVAWLGVKLVLEGLRPGTALALALATGLALVSKLSALALLPFVLLAFIVGAARSLRSEQNRLVVWLTMTVPLSGGLILSGLWLLRNFRLTGKYLPRDPWFIGRFIDRWLGRAENALPIPVEALPSALYSGFRTFWASFGWGNLEAYSWVYILFTVLSLAGLAGLSWWAVRRKVPWDRKVAAGLLLLLVASLLFMATYREFDYGARLVRGRYLLPALAAVAVLIALGLETLLRLIPTDRREVFPLALGGLLMITNVLVPLDVIAPAYALPPMLSDDNLLPGEQLLKAHFGNAAELVAYETWPESVRPGEALGVTLLWRVLGSLERNYTLGVHLLGEGQIKVGETNIYPGRGNYATTLWRAGDLFRETYWVTVREPITQPVMGRVKVAFFLDDHTQAHLPVTDAQGNPLGEAVVFGRFKLAPTALTAEPASVPGLALLGETIRLSEATWPGKERLLIAGDAFTVTLTWDVLGRPPADYTVFLHLEGPTGPVAYGDGPPAGGVYPTGLWDRGERIVDRHVVRLPPEMPAGEYALVTGLYDVKGQRAVAHGPNGERLPADQILLDHVTVVRRDRRNFIPLILRSED